MRINWLKKTYKIFKRYPGAGSKLCSCMRECLLLCLKILRTVFLVIFFLPGWTSQWHCWIVYRLILYSRNRKTPGACWVTAGTSERLDDHLPGCHTTEDDSGPPLSVDIWGNYLLLNKFHHRFMLVESLSLASFEKKDEPWKFTFALTTDHVFGKNKPLPLWLHFLEAMYHRILLLVYYYGFDRCRIVTVNFSCDFVV